MHEVEFFVLFANWTGNTGAYFIIHVTAEKQKLSIMTCCFLIMTLYVLRIEEIREQ